MTENIIKLDLIDKKILCELDIDCRIPLSRLAKKLRISRTIAGYRIKRLEEQKIITDYICSVKLGKLGYSSYKVYCKMKSMTVSKEKEFVDFIKNEKRIIHFLKTEGSFDYAFVIATKNIVDLDLFLSEIKSRFNEILNDYIVSIVVSSKIFKLHKLLLENKNELLKFDRSNDEQKEIDLDDKDKKILRVLSQEANISLIDLSIKTGLTIDIVKYRLKELSQKIVSSYRIIVDMNKIGFFHYVVMLKIRNANKNQEDELVLWCRNKKNVLFITKRIGSFDYEINVAIKDINELNEFFTELKTKFGNIIDSQELIINSKLIKLNYLPL